MHISDSVILQILLLIISHLFSDLFLFFDPLVLLYFEHEK
jgi:hypothetical protein